MVVPFGISIGDFVALGQLAQQIATALSECRGAAADFKSLIELLGSLENSLRFTSDYVSSSSFSTAVNVDQAFLNGLSFHADCCYRLLNQFKVDSRKYTDRLIIGRGSKAQTMFRKLKWSLYNVEDARKLEQRLTSHLEAFDRYLLAVDIQLGAQSTQRLQSQVGQVSHSLTEITNSVRTIQLNMPRHLGYPWEADPVSSYIYLDDVLGRTTILPAVLCRNFGTFYETLKIMFSDHPGFEKVVNEEFEIVDETTGRPIFQGHIGDSIRNLQSSTKPCIRPGSKLSMAVLSVQTLHAPTDSLVSSIQSLESCPNCGFQTMGKNFRKCLNCDLSFRKTVLESAGDMPRRGKFDVWLPVAFTQRQVIQSLPPSGSDCVEHMTDEDVTNVGLASQSTEAGIESKSFQRVHHITKYLVPLQGWVNYFGNSRLPLIQAAGQGNVQWVRDLLLHTDTDPNCRSFQGWTALQQACSATKGDPKTVVKLLIARGADVNAKPGEGYAMTALQAACEAGNAEVVDILLSEGADINAEAGPIGGKRALAAASWAGHLGIVKKLLDLGADINGSGSGVRAHTALSAAAQRGDLEMIDYLVQRGAKTSGGSGSVALENAVSWDQLDVARRLLDLGVNVKNEVDGQTPIHRTFSLKMLDLLLAHGAEVNTLSSRLHGYTALQHAARHCHLDLIREFIRLGADVHAPGPAIRGRTALQSAASDFDLKHALSVVKLLVDEYGADVNEARCHEEGYTSLEAACHTTARFEEVSDLGMVEFLLKRGAKITPFTLHVAAAWGNTKLASLLLRKGAQIQEPSDIQIVVELLCDLREFGTNAIETARLNGYPECAEMLEAWVDPH